LKSVRQFWSGTCPKMIRLLLVHVQINKLAHLATQSSEERCRLFEKNQSIIPLRRRYSLLSVEDLAKPASLHPKHLEKFVGFGLIEHTVRTGWGPLFRRSSLERLRRIHRLTRDLGIDLAGIAAVWTCAAGDDGASPVGRWSLQNLRVGRTAGPILDRDFQAQVAPVPKVRTAPDRR
jgi:DNA-binding transcriptional MerR regulator